MTDLYEQEGKSGGLKMFSNMTKTTLKERVSDDDVSGPLPSSYPAIRASFILSCYV